MKATSLISLAGLILLFSACATTQPAPDEATKQPAISGAERAAESVEEIGEEEIFMTLVGPMTISDWQEASERGDTPNAQQELERFAGEAAKLREAADRVPRLGEGDVEETVLRLELLTELDQFARRMPTYFDTEKLTRDELIFLYSAAGKVLWNVDEENTAEIKAFWAAHGWPKISVYGAPTDRRAWLLVQHADHDVEFQQAILKDLALLVEEQETSPSNYAYLFDRVTTNTGAKQRYGTQGACTGPGTWEPRAVEDPEELDERRKTRGLAPMEKYKAQFVDICR